MDKLDFLSNLPEEERDIVVSLDCEYARSHEGKDLLVRAVLLDACGHVILGIYFLYFCDNIFKSKTSYACRLR